MSNYVRPGVKPVYKIRTVGSNFSLDKAMPTRRGRNRSTNRLRRCGRRFRKGKTAFKHPFIKHEFDDLEVAAEVLRVRFGSVATDEVEVTRSRMSAVLLHAHAGMSRPRSTGRCVPPHCFVNINA